MTSEASTAAHPGEVTGEHADASAAGQEAAAAVAAAGQAARAAARQLRQMPAEGLDETLRAIAARLGDRSAEVAAANSRDVQAAKAEGLASAFVDRLTLDPGRIAAMADQLRALAEVGTERARVRVRDLHDGLELQEWRRPVGVIGANFEARPNVVVDIASQLIKSRNAGVLRTGSSAIGSAGVLIDEVVGPAMASTGLDPAAIQLLRSPGRQTAFALVREPALIPLVILRGSGESTRALAREAALHGVRTLAHADGGAVIYLDSSAGRELAQRIGVAVSLPPHQHRLGLEWALEAGSEATITVAPAAGATDAADIANTETSGLAAAVVAEDAVAAGQFLDAYAGTGAFWNASPRLLDGFKLLSLPETGINIDAVPGPRGPVTFRDLYLRQYAVVPRRRPV